MVGEAHQEQLEILQQHWNLMQDFEKGKLESFQQEHAMLKQKQLHLLQEVQSQLQEMSNEPTCKRKVHDVTFGNSVSAPQPRGSYRVLVMGAGQLGREVCKNFKLPKWEVQNLEFDADLRMFEAQMTEFQPQVVLNLLGTELDDRLSFRNFGAKTIAMATACDAHGVWLIHLSSDMVFDGTAPPYTVNAEPNPVTQAFDFRMRFTFDYV